MNNKYGGIGTDGVGEVFERVRQMLNATNVLGVPFFMPVKLGNELLPNEPSLTIVSKKNIVETIITGSKVQGIVHELVSVGNYEITIRGLILNKYKLFYPEQDVKRIHDLYKLNESLPILCGLTELLGINRVIITDLSFPEMVGIQHAQGYELKCVSDLDFDLEIL